MRDALSVEMVAVGAGEALAQVVMMGESDPPITASLGPIDRLICRLKSLEGSEQTLPVGLRVNQIGKLREHLEKFHKPLKNLSEMEETSFRAKWWMKEVRELCYDTEDYLVQSGAGAHITLGRIARFIISWNHSKVKWCTRVSRFMARAEVLKKTCETIIDVEIKNAISLEKGKEAVISLEREKEAVTETLIAQLFDLLAFEDDKQPQLKVVIISGFAGSGKTTLARTLYVKCKRRFQCSAFVRVSRNPDFRSLLTSMLSQIKAPSPHGLCDVQGLICSISDHLRGKRYFIVIDDVRSPSVWDIISRAFPADNFRSKIIVTTQSEQVEAAYSGYMLKSAIFKMGATDDGCTHTSTKEKSNALNIRYNNLPLHLKTCLLYLGMHPEGCTIRKDDLVKQWVAEVFIPAGKTGETSQIPQNKEESILEISQYETEEIAEVPQDGISEILEDQPEQIAQVYQDQREEIAGGYFDELVTRGMLQPVDINHKGEILSCTVHHLVLDLIRYKSKEDNFLIVVDNLESTLGHPDIVRRLSVQFGCEKGASIPESIILSQVRSLIFYGFLECVPSFADYGLLRVLNLHIWADEDKIFDLTRIGELCYLRYLKIECNVAVRLPLKIRRLQHLGTLELLAQVVSIPSDIGHLKKLLHVHCPCKADVRDLSELTNLRDLQLTCYTVENLEDNMKCIHSVLEKLSSLRCLVLVPASGSCSVNTLTDNPSRMCIVSPAPAHLQKLELSRRCCIFSRLPDWIGELHELCVLKIATRELSREDIAILKGLPALTTLSLHLQIMAAEMTVFGKGGFSLLTHFKFKCNVPWLKFEDDAMPNLEKLKLCFNSLIEDEQETTPIIIIERLSGLKEISAIIDSAGADVGSAWWKAIRNDRGNPKVQLMGSIYFDEQVRETLTREGSGEDENTEADIRVLTKPESSHLPVPAARCREDEPEDRPFISEIISIPNESESTDGHSSSQVVMHGKQTGSSGPGRVQGGYDELSQGAGGAHGGGSSLVGEGGVKAEAAPLRGGSYAELIPARVPVALGTGGVLLQPPEPGDSIADCPYLPLRSRQVATVVVFAGKSVTSAAISYLVNKALDYLDKYRKSAGMGVVRSQLRQAMPQIQSVLDVVQPQRIREQQSRALDKWLWQLRDAVEEAEDSIDELDYHELEAKAKDQKISGQCSCFVKINNKFVRSVKNASPWNKTLKRLVKAVNGLDRAAKGVGRFLDLTGGTASSSQLQMQLVDNDRQTSSALSTTLFVGREEEKEQIIRWLTNTPAESAETMASTSGVPIVSLVGHGGMGKTTLVQSVCDSSEVKSRFKVIWVTVSTAFNATLVTSRIVECATREKPSSNLLEPLQISLQEIMNSLTFLLVLDDVWEDKNIVEWEKLFAPFRKLNTRSKILLTTRMQSVASIAAKAMMVEEHSLTLGGLKEHENLQLFNHHVYSGLNAQAYGNLTLIGEEIARKLGGCPLVTKVASCHLHDIMTVIYWENFLEKGLEHFKGTEQDIMKILKLSYYHLPVELQMCFRFCSLFPEDHEFFEEELVRMWVGSGLISQATNYLTLNLKETGEQFLAQLTRKSFFDVKTKELNGVVGEEYYVMHDILHELAINVSFGECASINDPTKFYDKKDTVRHICVSHIHNFSVEDLKRISYFKNLRSIIINSSDEVDKNKLCALEDVVESSKSLRLFHSRLKNTFHIADKFGELKHLRYLYLDRISPEGIRALSKLYHLTLVHYENGVSW